MDEDSTAKDKEADRLAKWRAERAAIALKARQERLKQAEAAKNASDPEEGEAEQPADSHAERAAVALEDKERRLKQEDAAKSVSGPKVKEADRLAKWHAERAAVALEAKQERLKQAEVAKNVARDDIAQDIIPDISTSGIMAEGKKTRVTDRKKQLASEEKERIGKAAETLPGKDELQEVRKTILRQQRMRRVLAYFQFLLFVILPTALTGWYVAAIATPLYEARSVVTIAKPGGQTDPTFPGVLGMPLSQGNLNEAFIAKEFIDSEEMIRLMEEQEGLITYLGDTEMDPLQRLRYLPELQVGPDSYYHRYVRSAVNIQTGLLTLYVSARRPEDAQKFSMAILKFAEGKVRSLSQALFQERIAENEAAVERARKALEDVRRDLIELQISSGYANPEERIAEVYKIISTLEAELLLVHREMDDAELGGYSDFPQMKALIEKEAALQKRIQEQRDRLILGTEGQEPLNKVLADFQFKVVQKEIAEQTWSAALAALETARSSASLGLSQFQIVVPPNVSFTPKRPNRIKTTLLAFLMFFGLFAVFKVFRPKVS